VSARAFVVAVVVALVGAAVQAYTLPSGVEWDQAPAATAPAADSASWQNTTGDWVWGVVCWGAPADACPFTRWAIEPGGEAYLEGVMWDGGTGYYVDAPAYLHIAPLMPAAPASAASGALATDASVQAVAAWAQVLAGFCGLLIVMAGWNAGRVAP